MAKELADFSILQGWPTAKQHEFLSCFPILFFKDQETILEKDDVSSDAYFIAEGAVKVINLGADGQMAYFTILDRGECFGYYAALSGKPRTATVIAAEDTKLVQVPAKDFVALVTTDSEVARRFLETMTEIMRADTAHITSLTTLSAPEKVITTILAAQSEQKQNTVTMPSRVEWGGHLAMTRETLSRILNDLAHRGWITIKGDHIQIKDESALEKSLAER